MLARPLLFDWPSRFQGFFSRATNNGDWLPPTPPPRADRPPLPISCKCIFRFWVVFFLHFLVVFFAALNRNDSDVSREFFQGLGILSNGP